jgi:hypothetical protein
MKRIRASIALFFVSWLAVAPVYGADPATKSEVLRAIVCRTAPCQYSILCPVVRRLNGREMSFMLGVKVSGDVVILHDSLFGVTLVSAHGEDTLADIVPERPEEAMGFDKPTMRIVFAKELVVAVQCALDSSRNPPI